MIAVFDGRLRRVEAREHFPPLRHRDWLDRASELVEQLDGHVDPGGTIWRTLNGKSSDVAFWAALNFAAAI